MKAMAYAAAKQCWPEAEIEYEGVVGDLRADVLVSRHTAIEVQHKNASKDIEAVVQDYLENFYRVLMLYPRHFESGPPDLVAAVQERKQNADYRFTGADVSPSIEYGVWRDRSGPVGSLVRHRGRGVWHYTLERSPESADKGQLAWETTCGKLVSYYRGEGPSSNLKSPVKWFSEIDPDHRCPACEDELLRWLGHR